MGRVDCTGPFEDVFLFFSLNQETNNSSLEHPFIDFFKSFLTQEWYGKSRLYWSLRRSALFFCRVEILESQLATQFEIMCKIHVCIYAQCIRMYVFFISVKYKYM